MAMYEPIRGYSDDDERRMADPIMKENINIGGGDGRMNDDVEMAIRPDQSPTGGGAAYTNSSNEEATVASLPSKSRQQQQRLGSLDVFRGLTVVVTSTTFPGFSYSSISLVFLRRKKINFNG